MKGKFYEQDICTVNFCIHGGMCAVLFEHTCKHVYLTEFLSF